ncbi:hypothetical protein SAMD00023353_1100330 [Rosellinia necatrix]|uniref:Uncharacterized protein n=1 Tax=Rosellinia necatrix TaxID=77044 RepID=A0A1S7UMY9_ROSNE|nr:hypothetical protein SAMD00023353_1100330 [Rosellinia necatrix]
MASDTQGQNVSTDNGRPVAPKRKRADTSSSTEPATTTSHKRPCLVNNLYLSLDDAKVLGAVDARYDVQSQSVISSSKIQQRVSTMLRHLTPPPWTSSVEPAPNTPIPKTKVSVLRARAMDAGKLVSIAEIAKREIEGERLEPTSDGVPCEGGQASKMGRWFQYIAIGEELQERNREKDGTVIKETILGSSGVGREDDDQDDEFEVMKTPFERAIEGRPLVRGIPVVSLFLSRSPIEELKKRYGEQTNTLPT